VRRSGVLLAAFALGACGVKAAPRPAASAGTAPATAPAEAAPPAGGAPTPPAVAPGAGTGGR
jgi:hypothetical protein